MPQALPLVTFDQASNNFSVDTDTLNVLAHIPAPLAVVSIAGLFRTGKSFLMNRVILHAPSTGRRVRKTAPLTGFGVGNTVQACTKGIWMWSDPLVVKDASGTNVNVVVLDTEGSGAPSADANHDARISSLGLLLSSYFVYNSTGRIDDSSLSALTTVTHVTSEMREEDATQLPGFLWVLRDFALQLQNRDGQEVDPNAYMEEQLSGDKKDARAHLRQYFPDRGCATLIRPVMNESDLQSLNTLGDSALRPEFLQAASALRERILSSTANRPLKHNDALISGSMLATLTERYVSAVNNGAVPHIADAWESVCAVRMAEAASAMLANFPSTLNTLVTTATSSRSPVDTLRADAQTVLDRAWDTYVGVVGMLGTPPRDLRIGMVEQMEAAVTRYEEAWTGRVSDAATNVVDGLVTLSEEFEQWNDFWTIVEARKQTFLQNYGNNDITMFLFLHAAQKLWDIVPAFFGETPANAARVIELEAQIAKLEDDMLAASRAATHEADAARLRMEGLDKRMAAMHGENEEMHRVLTKAQEEVRGMTEDVMEVGNMRKELSSQAERVRELEDELTSVEDEAARKATEMHATALKSVEAVKNLRDADARRFEAELADARSRESEMSDTIATMRGEHDATITQMRAATERGIAQTAELADAVTRAQTAEREMRAREDTSRAMQMRVSELERQLTESEERAQKRPRVSEVDTLALVRAETELGFLRTQKNDLTATLTACRARCSDLERQMRTVQRSADEIVQRERLSHVTAMAQMEMRGGKA